MNKPNKYMLASRETLLGMALHRDQLKKELEAANEALMLLAGALTEADPSLTRVEMVKIAKEALK